MNKFVFLFLLSFLGHAQSYIVKEGDTLSEISQDKLFSPVYGEAGALEAILKLNPQVSDRNLIFPSQSLNLSLSDDVDEENGDKTLLGPKQSESYYLRVISLLSYARIDNSLDIETDTRAISNLGKGLKLEIGKKLNSKWSYFLSGQYTQFLFEVADSRTLEDSSSYIGDVSIGSSYSPSADWELRTRLGYEVINTLVQKDQTTLKIEEIKTPFISFKPGYRFSYNNIEFMALLPFKYSFGGSSFDSNFDLKNMLQYGLGLEVKKEYMGGKFIAGVNYDYSIGKLESIDSQGQLLEASFGYEFNWGDK